MLFREQHGRSHKTAEGSNIRLLANAVGRRANLTLSASRETKKVNEMIEQVINRRNMHLAYKQVLANKGSAASFAVATVVSQGKMPRYTTADTQMVKSANHD